MPKKKPRKSKTESKILASVLRTAKRLEAAGLADKSTMHEFNTLCGRGQERLK